MPGDREVEREFRTLLKVAEKYQPAYLDVILMASQFGFRYLAVKAVVGFLRWGST